MSESYPARPRVRSPFIVTPYIVAADGTMVPELPDRCPLSVGTTGPVCEIVAHHRRERKAGPEFDLTVAFCRGHRRAFTLYPPGYAPYRRQAVVQVAPGGSAIQREGDTGACDDFDATLFEAALHAQDGRAWARESGDMTPAHWWSTQDRHLSLAMRIVGVARSLGDHVREKIAAVLAVDLLALREWTPAPGYRNVGRAVASVLSCLRGGSQRARRLLICGHLAGCWGEPLHWDRERHMFGRSPFQVAGTLAPP